MKHARRLSFSTGLFLLAGTAAQTARAAVYLPMPDRDLAREATAVVLARPVDQKIVLGTVDNENRPFNLMTFEMVIDTLTGAVKNYTNPQGTAFQPIQDTSAFSCAVSASAFAGN